MIVKENHQLKDYNTFHISASAKTFIEVFSREEVTEVCKYNLNNRSYFILGGGSNILLLNDADLIVKISIPGISIIEENEESAFLKAGAGVIWNDLVEYAIGMNLGGIENLILIPGTAGAAPIQNIGAYGQELKDTFHSLEAVLTNTGETITLTHQDCRFGYRSSIFKSELKNKVIITSITLRLNKNPEPQVSYSSVKALIDNSERRNVSIRDVSRIIADIRKSKLPDPEVIGNAGSFFKNPEVNNIKYEKLKELYPDIPAFKTSGDNKKIAAGWLIEQCGWKGMREGDAGSHKDQALVLVNYGNASGKDILSIAKKIKKSVHQKFEIDLEEEVNII